MQGPQGDPGKPGAPDSDMSEIATEINLVFPFDENPPVEGESDIGEEGVPSITNMEIHLLNEKGDILSKEFITDRKPNGEVLAPEYRISNDEIFIQRYMVVPRLKAEDLIDFKDVDLDRIDNYREFIVNKNNFYYTKYIDINSLDLMGIWIPDRIYISDTPFIKSREKDDVISINGEGVTIILPNILDASNGDSIKIYSTPKSTGEYTGASFVLSYDYNTQSPQWTDYTNNVIVEYPDCGFKKDSGYFWTADYIATKNVAPLTPGVVTLPGLQPGDEVTVAYHIDGKNNNEWINITKIA